MALPSTSRRAVQSDERLEELDRLARMLDTRWRIPGTPVTFGVDAVAGLVPGVGDAATGLISAYMVYRAARLDVPRGIIARMVGNILLDVGVGAVPLLGSVFDLFFKANIRNIRLLRRHLEREAARR